MNKLVWFFLLLGINSMWGQVKVGDNIDTIDPSSIMELESTTKVFVVTRLSASEMNSITPLNGALVYNIDDQCLFQYRDDMWNSLCVDVIGGQTITTLTDNLDGTITYSNETNTATTITKSNLTNNGNGTYTFSNGSSNIILDTNASALPYSNVGSGLSATNLQDAIDELKASSNVDGLTISGTGTIADPYKVEDAAIVNSKLANDAITSEKIIDGEVKTVDLEDDAITAAKINSDVAGNGLTQNASGALEVDIQSLTGDGSLSTPQNTIQISGTPTNALLDDVQIDVADDAIDNSKIADNAVRTENILNSSILNEDIADFEIAATKLSGGLPNEVLQTDAVGNAEWDLIQAENINAKDLTAGDTSITINNGTGATIIDTDIRIATDGVTNAKMADNSVGTPELVDDAVNSSKIQNETVLSEDILNGTITDIDLDKSNIPLSGFGSATNDIDLGGNNINNLADPISPQDAATKNYVDGQIAATADDDITAVSLDGTSLLTIDEGATSISVDLSALEESAAIAAVQTDVDTNEADADAAIAAVQTDVDTNEADADAAIATNATAITAEETRALAAEAAIQTDVDTNEADADAAIAANTTAITAEETRAIAAEAAIQADVDTNEADADAAIAAVQSDVDTNEADADAAIATVQTNLNTHTTADQDLSVTNEIQTLSISGSDLTISGTGGNTVSLPSSTETTTTLVQNTSTGVITYTNEVAASQTANIVGAETDNSIAVGTNGGAYYSSPIRAFGKIASAGTVVKATPGITITKLTGNGHYRVNLGTTMTDANYIIQLTQPGRNGAGNDDPGIAYANQTTTSFEVIIGDNDNGGTDRARFDSEFMFTIIDL